MKRKWISIITVILIIASALSGCSAQKKEAAQNIQAGIANETQENAPAASANTTTAASASTIEVDKEFTARDLEVGYEESSAVLIVLNGTSISVKGDGAAVTDQKVTIQKEGSYVIEGTLEDGQIIVDAGDTDKVQLILNGTSVHNSSNAPIYIKNADKVFITLQEGTDNLLTDGAEYIQSDDNNVDAVIYSKADLTLNGSGSLTITGNYKHGIVSKDDLVFTGGIYDITAAKDAINGKDCVKIKDGSFTLNASSGNGIQSKNSDDATKGYVYICGGTVNVASSQEGIEGTVIIIEDGTIEINAGDDGLNAASGSTDTAGAENTASSWEALKGKPSASEGTSTLPAESGENAAVTAQLPKDSAMPSGEVPEDGDTSRGPGGADRGKPTSSDQMPFGQGQAPSGDTRPGGFGGGENPFETDANCYISISGGTIIINAEGDGIDSNGNLSISGGTIYVDGPTQSMNGSLDYSGNGDISGGILIAVGSSGMAQGFGETSTQYSLLYNLSAVNTNKDQITLNDASGKEIISYTPKKSYQSVLISSPDMAQGETYTLTCGTQTAEITLSSVFTTNGQRMGPGVK